MSLLELFGWAGWQSRDEYKSKIAVRKITNQKRLAKIAKEAPRFETCVLAIEKLDAKYQELFADIVLSDRYLFWIDKVHEAAVKKLTDQKLLSIVIEKYKGNDFDVHEIRSLAVKNLTNQSLLAEIAKNDKSDYVRKSAIENKYFTDQNILADIAENETESTYFRLKATEKLTDKILAQKIYTGIAENETEYTYSRLKATEKLTDKILAQKIYAGIAENDEDYKMRIEAAEKLTDQTFAQKVYADVIKNPPSLLIYYGDSVSWPEFESLAKRFVAKITDQNTIVDIAKNGKYKAVWNAVVEKLSDQELLVDVAKHAGQCAVRIMAAEKFTDKTLAEEVYFDVVYKSDSRDDCEKAIMKIADQRALATIAKSVTVGVYKRFKGDYDYSEDYRIAGSYGYLREMAIKKLTDPDVLTEIANGDEECYVYNGSINHIYYVDSDYNYCPIEYMLPVPHDNWSNDTLDLRETARKRMLELGYPVP